MIISDAIGFQPSAVSYQPLRRQHSAINSQLLVGALSAES